jgi:hypothetical protein
MPGNERVWTEDTAIKPPGNEAVDEDDSFGDAKTLAEIKFDQDFEGGEIFG